MEPAVPPQTQVFCGTPLVAVIVVVRGGGAKLAGSRLGPRRWVENKLARGIVGTAIIRILQEERLIRYTVGERAPTTRELRRDQAIGIRNTDWLAALVAEHGAERPVFDGPIQSPVGKPPPLSRVVAREHKHKRTR